MSAFRLGLSLIVCVSLQDSVFPRHELVSHSHVPLLLVLRHRRHGDCRFYLQVYRVCRVSGAPPRKRLDSLTAFSDLQVLVYVCFSTLVYEFSAS